MREESGPKAGQAVQNHPSKGLGRNKQSMRPPWAERNQENCGMRSRERTKTRPGRILDSESDGGRVVVLEGLLRGL